MVFADDIRKTILKLADERGAEKTFCPSDVAQAIDQKNWQMLVDQVELVASTLIQEGKIIATQDYKEPLRFRKK
ncbi:DUF3253 domain-containing protein [Ohtaekwangia koreensis]|jgi:hypothetical protein|uniref:DUF3253 domain-containing protein n=1 Tax=Ohtaekwangia koreensis TaxID=688867 RepID=A0A1T5LBL2_9BACT|nr:DUF3253 domain-containing protein [Ohtaekwangia koreensis]SKC73381.1 Protein of unknown function [Ohtaekwangia koreensis]